MGTQLDDVMERVNCLVDQYRVQCLWFLREDYYPATREQALQALGYIERHGDMEAFRKTGEVRRWLSQSSSEKSAI